MNYINPNYPLNQTHKDGLDYLAKHLKPKSLITDLVDQTVNFYLTIDKSINFEQSIKCKELICLVINRITLKGVNNSISNLSYLQNKFLSELLKFPFSNYQLTKNAIEDIEYRILISELSDKEKEILTVITAVAKSSNEYWDFQIKNYSSSPWKDFIDANSLQVMLPRWLKADLIGAGVGAAVGTALGGPGVGTATGAAIGGIAASGVELMFNWGM